MTAPTVGEHAHAEVAREGGVARVTIGDGTLRNALGAAEWDALREVAEQLAGDTTVSAVVLQGVGGTFCAGFRMDGWRDADLDQVDATFASMEAALQAVERIPVPTVAAVEGVAAGAGCQLALACDLRVVTASTRIGMPILRLGILCSPGFALRLSALVGPARTKELLFTGRLVTAQQAAGYGLVTRVVADDQLAGAVEGLLEGLLSHPRGALVAAKTATDVALRLLRADVQAPGWRFSDAVEFPARVRRFLSRSGRA